MRRFAGALVAMTLAGSCFAEDVEEGAAIYLDHCATCHGNDVDGDGPMAGAMLVKPGDLRKLTIGNGGEFPLVRVIKRIDGRDPLVSHGSPMPIYGDFFEGDDTPLKAETGQPIMTSRAIVELVTYLEGLQE